MAKEKNSISKSGSVTAKIILILFLGVLLFVEGFFGYRLHQLSDAQKLIKEDYANTNSIEYGLFSVKNWRDKVAHIVDHQVRNFTLTPGQKKDMQLEIQEILLALIDKAEAMVNKATNISKRENRKICSQKICGY